MHISDSEDFDIEAMPDWIHHQGYMEMDPIALAYRTGDERYQDTKNPLWFPPGVCLKVSPLLTYPPHQCFTDVMENPDTHAITTHNPMIGPCDNHMDDNEIMDWVLTLTDYPSYILMTYAPGDTQSDIRQERGHTLRNLVPRCHILDATRMNLAVLASCSQPERFHFLHDALAPVLKCDRFLVRHLIDTMPFEDHNWTFENWGFFFKPDSFFPNDPHLSSHYQYIALQANNWCIARDSDQKKDNRIKWRYLTPENCNSHLVFDLVCVYILTTDLFDNFDNQLKYECMSDYIPWSMMARYMDTSLFLNTIKPWFQSRQILSWYLYSKYSFDKPYDLPCFQQYHHLTQPGYNQVHQILPQSRPPWAGRIALYATSITPKIIFNADLQVRRIRSEVKFHQSIMEENMYTPTINPEFQYVLPL